MAHAENQYQIVSPLEAAIMAQQCYKVAPYRNIKVSNSRWVPIFTSRPPVQWGIFYTVYVDKVSFRIVLAIRGSKESINWINNAGLAHGAYKGDVPIIISISFLCE